MQSKLMQMMQAATNATCCRLAQSQICSIYQHTVPVPGSLYKKGGRRRHLLLNKRWKHLPPFLNNDSGTFIQNDHTNVVDILSTGFPANVNNEN
jgi:hypothetical protein